jgi:hypothetical protein
MIEPQEYVEHLNEANKMAKKDRINRAFEEETVPVQKELTRMKQIQ